MRAKRQSSGLRVQAVAGTYVVLLGIDLDAAKRKGCLGFAIRRKDFTEGEVVWLKGLKTFATTDPKLGPGGQVSSHEHPYQGFQWADYAAKPDHKYAYTVIPMYGTASALTDGDEVTVTVETEPLWGSSSSVFFNRGAIASQEYARRFLNRSPDDVGEPAFRWLARELLEALLSFIARAEDDRFAIYGAVYEFQRTEPLSALRDASKRGATVKVVYDAIPGNGPGKKNEAAIAAERIKRLTTPRTEGKIMHNKFLVLVKDGAPAAVWTGSTNLTNNGIFGHSNCAVVLEDPTIATAYLEYWNQIYQDEKTPADKDWVAGNNPAPPDPWDSDRVEVFSPRKGLDVLQWYADIAGSAKDALFQTFAFGMHEFFQSVYERDDNVLRVALMEKEGNGAGLAQGRIDVKRIRKRPNVLVAVGRNVGANAFDTWLEERAKFSDHEKTQVNWIHTKYMLVDPLGAAPVVVSGSANFSAASTNANHENMVVLRGDTRIADIYLGEFMRMYSHHAFRESLYLHSLEKGASAKNWAPSHLEETDRWQAPYFDAGDSRSLRRRYFAGT